MIIGNFKYDAKADRYAGDVTTLTFHLSDVQLRPVEKSSDEAPDYRIVTQTALGMVEFGAAWKRTTEGGQDFLSVSIDDPSLPAAVNAALFSDEDGEGVNLVWRRKKAEEPKASKHKAKAK